MAPLVYLKDVVSLRAQPERCLGCGLCLEVCPHGVLALIDKRVQVVRRDACMECGACMTNCPSGALSVEAGVGCAQAVINAALGRKGDACCCVAEPRRPATQVQAQIDLAPPGPRGGCC
ncbi:MAG: 4Fe-4S dicluster domain-containing protein [Desulfarculus sp.]|nr:MAG: 4Fe-4S dicluster domain-containing protein [Desulfarculus sp.]